MPDLHSAFCILHSASWRRKAFAQGLHSAFCILHSAFWTFVNLLKSSTKASQGSLQTGQSRILVARQNADCSYEAGAEFWCHKSDCDRSKMPTWDKNVGLENVRILFVGTGLQTASRSRMQGLEVATAVVAWLKSQFEGEFANSDFAEGSDSPK
jgi:hypothetical protein